MSWLSPTKELPETSRMGFRSLFVLMKLGFDMREHYEAEMDQRLPQEIERSLQVLAARETLARR
jgi:hypothetical protein